MDSYAGIGSRSTPQEVLDQMVQLAVMLSPTHAMRSGGCDGADSAFYNGAKSAGGKVEIFLPWTGYGNIDDNDVALSQPSHAAMDLSSHYHPAWYNCKQGSRKLHGRNAHIILGTGLDDPVDFVICYTPNGSGSGGTGQGIRIAKAYDIPVYDLGSMSFDELLVKLNLEEV